MDNLRPIHYLGNKSRYLGPIADLVDEVAGSEGLAIDLFAGTGVVTRALAATHEVTSIDVQAYSAFLANALTRPRIYDGSARQEIRSLVTEWLTPLQDSLHAILDLEREAIGKVEIDPDPFVSLLEHGSAVDPTAPGTLLRSAKAEALPVLLNHGAIITAHYGGVYFSYRQALEIDGILSSIGHRNHGAAEATLVASVLGAASAAVATVGSHFAQPTRVRSPNGTIKQASLRQVMRSRSISVLDSFDGWLTRYAELPPVPHSSTTITADFRVALAELGEEPVAAIYADPPYTRDHYSRFYHVLETIARADDPGVSLASGSLAPSRGLYRIERHQSPFSIRSRAPGAFNELFGRARALEAPVVLSYSPQGSGTRARAQTRTMTIEQLVSIARSFFSSVEVRVVDHSSHSRFNLRHLSGETPAAAELLVVARD